MSSLLTFLLLIIGTQATFVRKQDNLWTWGPLECDSKDFKHDTYNGEPFNIESKIESGTVIISDNAGKFQLEIKLGENMARQNYMGNWTCGENKWVVVGSPFISRLGKPADETAHRDSLAVMEEEKVTLLCEGYYFGEKEPTFSWSITSEEGVVSNQTDRWVISKVVADGNKYTSTLKLEDEAGVQMDDRAVYSCNITSLADGVAEKKILLRVKGKFAALWPFLGICAEVVILCLGIFIYERRTKARNADVDEDDAGHEAEVVTGGNQGDDVRKRSGVKT